MTKAVSRNAAKPVEKKKPRGKPFQAGSDARRNEAGQRNKEVVATAAQARALYVEVLHEPINAPLNTEMSNLEMVVRKHVSDAEKGDAQAREQMFDRIWGKALQPVDLTNSDGSLAPQAVMFIPYDSNRANPDNS